MKPSCALSVLALLSVAPAAHAVDVVMSGGPALSSKENLREKGVAHDKWWANFIRAATVRIALIQAKNPDAKITWIVYRPGYERRGKEDGKPYVQWIKDLAKKYKVKLVWVDTGEGAVKALNNAPRGGEKVDSFYYFGHSNLYAFMLDYGNAILAVSTAWIHESELAQIDRNIFAPNADCWSFGCYTGMSMSYWWKQTLGIPLNGNLDSTQYGPVSNGYLPKGNGKWVKGDRYGG